MLVELQSPDEKNMLKAATVSETADLRETVAKAERNIQRL